MHRLLIQCGRLQLNGGELGKQMIDLTRHISSSHRCNKQSQITDDLNDTPDTPTYCENQQTKKLSNDRFKDFMEQTLLFPSSLAAEICLKHPEFKERSLNDIKKNVALLTQKGVTKPLIADNPWMLTMFSGW